MIRPDIRQGQAEVGGEGTNSRHDEKVASVGPGEQAGEGERGTVSGRATGSLKGPPGPVGCHYLV